MRDNGGFARGNGSESRAETKRADQLPWQYRNGPVGCWCWSLVWSMLAGLFLDAAWFWGMASLLIAALVLLARDPNNP